VGDGHEGRAGRRVGADGSRIGEIIDRVGEGGDVGHIVGARIVTVEKIEEFGEGDDRPAIMKVDGPADAQIGLYVGRSSKLVQGGFYSVDHGALSGRRSERQGTRTFGLREGGEFDATGQM